jgi:hypothetical protein
VSHLGLVFSFIGRLEAIRAALNYDLSRFSREDHDLTGPAAILWRTNFEAWRLAAKP